jgi:hypothetical protein
MYIRINNPAPNALTFYYRLHIKKRTTAGATQGEAWFWPENCDDFPPMKVSGTRTRRAVRN